MLLFHLVILALVQGITEFLPVSSSGHLVLAHHLLGPGALETDRMIDIAVHVGTLFAVLLYFRRDIARMAGAVKDGPSGRSLLFLILAGSLPVVIAGGALHIYSPSWLQSLHLMAWCTLVFGIVLWLADRAPAHKTMDDIGMKQAFLIGVAQVLALVPGTSRSGITMSAARAMGINRVDAARFSLLLAIVAISGAGALGGFDLWRTGDMALGFDVLVAVTLAFLSAWAAIALMMRWLERASFTVFALYRVVLGGLLLVLLYGGVLGAS